MRLYVSNLSSEITDADLRKLFGMHGRVESAQVVPNQPDEIAGGIGLVSMPSRPAALEATAALRGHRLKGQLLEVNEIRVPPKRVPGQIFNRTKRTHRGGKQGQHN